jgi:hypothetical protein
MPCPWEADTTGSRLRPATLGAARSTNPSPRILRGAPTSQGSAWFVGTPPFPKGGRPPGKRFKSHTWELLGFLGKDWSFLGGEPDAELGASHFFAYWGTGISLSYWIGSEWFSCRPLVVV